eukprot:g5522.t1
MLKNLPALARGSHRLYLIRHGETDYNRKHIIQGTLDIPLNGTGHAQARALAEAMASLPLDAVASSQLRRAAETAEAIAERHTCTWPKRARLRALNEMCFGCLEGQVRAAGTAELHDRILRDWARGLPTAFPGAGGEGPEGVERRLRMAIHGGPHALLRLARPGGAGARGGRRASGDGGAHVALVCHGRALKLFLASALGTGLETSQEIPQPNTAVSVLDWDIATGAFRALAIGNDDHTRSPSAAASAEESF